MTASPVTLRVADEPLADAPLELPEPDEPPDLDELDEPDALDAPDAPDESLEPEQVEPLDEAVGSAPGRVSAVTAVAFREVG
ncbi:MAG: hypothetical protein ACTHJJ_11655 [Intrasporangium sp.]|uniref:hypothetical protein n=1 Tax=Intrasporangium sp. TaxID=1925024 RepID=UPI003F7DB732